MEHSDIVTRLQMLAAESESWADFSNDLFSKDGALARLVPDGVQRGAFMRARKKELKRLLNSTINKHGLLAGSTPRRKTANIVLRLPVSLHRELKSEALEEGVSLNQLMILKLAAQLKRRLYEKKKARK